MLVAAGNPHVRLFDVAAKRSIRSLEGHKGNVVSSGFHRNCSWLFTASEDKTIKIWDTRAPGVQRNYDCDSPINCATLHPNQAEIVTGDSQGRICIWDLAADALAQTIQTDAKSPIRDVSVAVDASMLVAGNDRGSCFVWDSSEGAEWTPQLKFEGHKGYCLKTVLSPDLKYLATASSDRTLNIWDVRNSFALLKTLSGHQRWVWDCTFSADSAYILSVSSDKTARLWEMESGNPVVEYRGHQKAVVCVALNDSAVEA